MKPRHRKLIRRTWRTTRRGISRSCVRIRWRAPDDLAESLTAMSRALRAQRRLAKLAPRFFDSATVDREARERAAQRRWLQSWEPLLEKYYGPTPPAQRAANACSDLPPLPGPRTQRAVERELAAWNFSFAAGSLAAQRHRQRHPHALPTFTQLARLADIAISLGRLACGLDSTAPLTPPRTYGPDFDAALKRVYGKRPQNSTSQVASPSPIL